MEKLNVAVPTPFDDREELNVDSFLPMIQDLKEKGIDSIFVCGTTGEQHSLSLEEKMKIVDYFNSQSLKGVELIFGIAATTTKEAIRLVEKVEDSVFDAVMIGFPPYIKPTQQQAIDYVGEIIKRTTKEVAIYNNPSRTGFDLTAESLQTLLSDYSQITALKDGGDIERHRLKAFPESFTFFAAGDVGVKDSIRKGCNGLSSMIGNIYPEEMKEMLMDLLENEGGNHEKYRQLIDKVTSLPLIDQIKKHYNKNGIDLGVCRSPL